MTTINMKSGKSGDKVKIFNQNHSIYNDEDDDNILSKLKKIKSYKVNIFQNIKTYKG